MATIPTCTGKMRELLTLPHPRLTRQSAVGYTRMTPEQQIEMIRRAWLDKGSHPAYHVQQQERLRLQWPTLYRILTDIAKSG
jgi:hypothetical protein